MDGWIYGRLEIHPCVLQDIGPLGLLPKKGIRPRRRQKEDSLKSKIKKRKRNEKHGKEEQVTRGHNIVADGWAGASNLQPYPNHTLNPPPLHSNTNNINRSIKSTRFSRFQLKRDNSSVTDQRTDGPTDQWTDGPTKRDVESRSTRRNK